MQKPHIWIWLMILLSVLAFLGNTSVTIFTAGILSIPTAVLMGAFITSIPMIFLLFLDRRGLKRRGLVPPSTFWTYFFAVVFPSYVMTIAYLVFRPTSNTEEVVNSDQEIYDVSNENSFGEEILSNYVDELPPLSETRWSESDLKGLSESTYHTNISDMIQQDMEDDNMDFTTYETDTGVPVSRSREGEVVALPVRLDVDRINSTEKGLGVTERLRDEFDADLITAYTDTHIDDSVCVDLIDRSGIFLVTEEMTRQTLKHHSISPPN